MAWTLISGASSGIGKACAELLGDQGHSLWLVARRKDRLDAIAESLKKAGIKPLTTKLDIGDADQVDRFGKEFSKELAEVGVLINNAGLALGTDPIQEGRFEDWANMINVNLIGLLKLTRLVLPHMVEKRHGHIVNVGSVAGRWVYPGGNVYCATKSAVHSLSESMRLDLLGKGIRVSEVSPGMVETEFSEVRFKDPERARAVYAGMTPLKARDVAETVAWCLSQPAHVNIQEIVVYPTSQASPNFVHRR